MIVINKDWTWAAVFGAGAFIVGFCLAVITLVHLWDAKVYDKFTTEGNSSARNQLFVTAAVYIAFVCAVFLVAFVVWLATRHPHGAAGQFYERFSRTTTSRGGHPAIF